jgi:hypothetical protein
MKKENLVRASIGLLMFLFVTDCTAASILQNGSFESPVIPANTYQPGTPTSWRWSGATGYIDSGSPIDPPTGGRLPSPQDGQQYVDIGNVGSYVLSQNFSITEAAPYRLAWYDSAYYPADTSPYSVSVTNSSLQTVTSQSFNGAHGGNWVARELWLNLGPGTYTLTFTAQGHFNGYDTYLDNVSLTQANTCGASLSPTSQSFTPSSGSQTVTVATGVGCPWTATSAAGWITIISGANGTGSGTMNYAVAANAGSTPRTGTISIAGQTFSVTQAGTAPTPITALMFAQVAVGGGWTTKFTIVNIGATQLSGTLILTDKTSSPLVALIGEENVPSSFLIGSSYPLSIEAGGSRTITASASSSIEGAKTGWARVDGIGGTASGVAVFQFREGNSLKSTAGVLSSQALQTVTIPVDNNEAQNRFTGFAVANQNLSSLAVRLVLVGEDGTVLENLMSSQLSIPARGQVSIFLHEILSSRRTFKGSMVLSGQGGLSFAAVGLVIEGQGLITAIPTIPGKAPHVPQ